MRYNCFIIQITDFILVRTCAFKRGPIAYLLTSEMPKVSMPRKTHRRKREKRKKSEREKETQNSGVRERRERRQRESERVRKKKKEEKFVKGTEREKIELERIIETKRILK